MGVCSVVRSSKSFMRVRLNARFLMCNGSVLIGPLELVISKKPYGRHFVKTSLYVSLTASRL